MSDVTPGKTPLHLATFENDIECCKLLLKSGAKQDTVDETGRCALHWAVRQNLANMVTFFLGSGTNVNTMSDNGEYSRHTGQHGHLRHECQHHVRQW